MARSARKVGRNRSKKYQFKSNSIKRQNQKRKKHKTVKCEQVEAAWERNKTVRANLDDMGLVYDLNNAIRIPKTKSTLKANWSEGQMEVVESPSLRGAKKPGVIAALEAEANHPGKKTFRLSQPELRYCVYMMEKYGDNYEAAARDPKNHYQETPAQIRRKIANFKAIPSQYQAYLIEKSGEKVDLTTLSI